MCFARTKFALDIFTIDVISGIAYFCVIILQSSWNASETNPWNQPRQVWISHICPRHFWHGQKTKHMKILYIYYWTHYAWKWITPENVFRSMKKKTFDTCFMAVDAKLFLLNIERNPGAYAISFLLFALCRRAYNISACTNTRIIAYAITPDCINTM